MARRGSELRDHILLAAKDVFLELGFERASMDEISARAATSKRTLYAHFASKEKLYMEVIAYVRSLFLERLAYPSAYADDPHEALVLFCGRFLENLLYAPCIRMCRLAVAEADRFPAASVELHAIMFVEAHERLASFLHERLVVTRTESAGVAHDLLGSVVIPRFLRALFGVDALSDARENDGSIRRDIDLGAIRRAVAAALDARERAPL